MNSIRQIGLVAVWMLGLALAACTEMPPVTGYFPKGQPKVVSAQHWQLIARDVAKTLESSSGSGSCLQFVRPALKEQTKFQNFLIEAVTTEIVSDYTPKQVDNSNPPTAIPIRYVRQAAADSRCDNVTIDNIVIQHKGVAGRPYPGQYTLLAQGIVVLRNVARAFSSASAVGAVALGEGAFWASSGLHSSATTMEIVITSSRMDSDGWYLSRRTDIYYINSEDLGLYQVQKTARDQTDPAGNTLSDSPNSTTGRESKPPQAVSASEESSSSKSCPLDSASNCLKPRRLVVVPRVISFCDPTAEFIVMGKHLARKPGDYQLGTLSGTSFGVSGPPKGRGESDADDTNAGADQNESVQIKFEGLQKANKGLDPLQLGMVGDDGVAGLAYVDVDTTFTCKDTPKAKTDSTETTTPTRTSTNQALFVVAPTGTPEQPFDACKLPLILAILGPEASLVQSAATLDGLYKGEVKITTVNGTPGTKTVTFKKLPCFKCALPDKPILRLQLTLSNKKTVSQDINIHCAG